MLFHSILVIKTYGVAFLTILGLLYPKYATQTLAKPHFWLSTIMLLIFYSVLVKKWHGYNLKTAILPNFTHLPLWPTIPKLSNSNFEITHNSLTDIEGNPLCCLLSTNYALRKHGRPTTCHRWFSTILCDFCPNLFHNTRPI